MFLPPIQQVGAFLRLRNAELRLNGVPIPAPVTWRMSKLVVSENAEVRTNLQDG
jgi:hypothetical protein